VPPRTAAWFSCTVTVSQSWLIIATCCTVKVHYKLKESRRVLTSRSRVVNTCPAHLIFLDLIIRPSPRPSKIIFYGKELLAPSWRTTPCLLSATAYSIYSQLHSLWILLLLKNNPSFPVRYVLNCYSSCELQQQSPSNVNIKIHTHPLDFSLP
jgi:hypothetical protein